MSILINNEYNVEINFSNDFNNLYKITKNILNINKDYELSVSFINDKEIKEINKTYRNIDSTTDVISFAMLDNEDLNDKFNSELDLGDIFISVDTAIIQAKNLNQSLEVEIRFLFVHGLLHLLGYDHQIESEEEEMFTLQRKIINEFTKENNRQI